MGRTAYDLILQGRRAREVKDVILEWARTRRIKVLEEGDEHVVGRFGGGFFSRVALNFEVHFEQHVRGVRIHVEGWITGYGPFEEDFSPRRSFEVYKRAGRNILMGLMDRLNALG